MINVTRTSFLYQSLYKISFKYRKYFVNQLMTIKILFYAIFTYKSGLINTIRHYLYLHKKLGFSAIEAQEFEILDPNVDKDIIGNQLSQKKLNQMTLALSPINFRYLLDNKIVFYRHCELNGIPVPKVYAVFIKNKFGYKDDNKLITNRDEWLNFIKNELPDDFLIKPADGFQGKGIVFACKKNGNIYDHNGSPLSAESIYDDLENSKLFDLFLFQERLYSHKNLATLSKTSALQTIRIITYIDHDNNFQVLYSLLKVICGNNIIDNLCHGALGNLSAVLDSHGGKVDYCYDILDRRKGFKKVINHPDTGLPFNNFELPYWKETIEMLEKASRAFLPLRSIGWDVALTDHGPVVVEGNYNHGVSREMGFFQKVIKY
jgi:hypothetical protein